MEGSKKTFGIIGGLGTLSGGDLFFKLLKSKTVLRNQENYHFIFEQHPYQQINSVLENESDITSRKFYAYNVSKGFEDKKVDRILLPCFASHTFIRQLQTELRLPVINLMEALEAHLHERFEKGTKIGILVSDFVKASGLFSAYLKDFELCYPESQNAVMSIVYGEKGIKNGFLEGLVIEQAHHICQELADKGCTVILPGITEFSLIAEQLWRRGFPVIDVNQVYADFAIDSDASEHKKPFKLGILGGVGPAATVDFMNKVIKNTSAKKDQDHIKMIVEQNPQIPDRTAHLLYGETDPTIAMFSTCKQLEAEGAEAIAIPCNTAHAFVERIQPYLSIPIINMISITIDHILATYGVGTTIGLAATSGTIDSRVYHDVASDQGLELIVPDEEQQSKVMESIYGIHGVKAGYTTGDCMADITSAIIHLAERGAEVVILGCTELPIIFPGANHLMLLDGRNVSLVDPTMILAEKCVALALANQKKA